MFWVEHAAFHFRHGWTELPAIAKRTNRRMERPSDADEFSHLQRRARFIESDKQMPVKSLELRVAKALARLGSLPLSQT